MLLCQQNKLSASHARNNQATIKPYTLITTFWICQSYAHLDTPLWSRPFVGKFWVLPPRLKISKYATGCSYCMNVNIDSDTTTSPNWAIVMKFITRNVNIKSNHNANEGDDLSFCKSDFETIWVEIDNLKAKNILWCYGYRYRSTDLAKFRNDLQEILYVKENENKIIYIMGDFNVNISRSCKSCTNKLIH